MLEILGIKGILATLGALAVAGVGIYIKILKWKAGQADAWKARAESAEREVDARMKLGETSSRIDAETNAGLEELQRESEAKKTRIDQGRTADESAENARRIFGGGAGPGTP